VDKEFIKENTFNNLPVVAFDEVVEQYPPDKYAMFVAVGYHDLNRVRQTKVQAAHDKGYELISYVHPNAGVPKDLKLGKNCFVMNHVMVHPRVELGDNNFVWSGTIIGHHSKIGHHNWFTSGANIAGNVQMQDNNFFAINATIGHSVNIGSECFVGSNALVTKNLADKSVVIEGATKLFRLNSDQFLRMSKFGDL
jgi:sugar O-acyltransferase (sialic acid O-acetyltransferase NeuD family)